MLIKCHDHNLGIILPSSTGSRSLLGAHCEAKTNMCVCRACRSPGEKEIRSENLSPNLEPGMIYLALSFSCCGAINRASGRLIYHGHLFKKAAPSFLNYCRETENGAGRGCRVSFPFFAQLLFDTKLIILSFATY